MPVGYKMEYDFSSIWETLISYIDAWWASTKEVPAEVVSAALGAIPVPEFIGQVGTFFAALPPDVVFYTSPFQFSLGLQMMLAAWVAGQVTRVIVGIIL